MKISIIVAVYGVEKYIARCANSLFNQTLDDIEYIFVNDCTLDKSMEVLQSVIEKFPHRKPYIKIINNNTNYGVGYTKQKGILLATSEYFTVCDPDDYLDADYYESLYKKAKESPADIVWCDIALTKNDSLRIYSQEMIENNVECIKKICGLKGSWSLCNKLFSKKLLQHTDIMSTYNYQTAEDLVLCIKLFYYAQKVVYCPQVYYRYDVREGSVTRSESKRIERSVSQKKAVEELEEFFANKKDYKVFRGSIIAVRMYFNIRKILPQMPQRIIKCLIQIRKCFIFN